MENASKALIIAGAILLAILIIGIGMLIFGNSQNAVLESVTSFSRQEIEGFNSAFEQYKGQAAGSNVSTLLSKLIANANTYKDEPTKIPTVFINKINASATATLTFSDANAINPQRGGLSTGQQTYIDNLTRIKNAIENKHTYTITLSYQSNGLVDVISIGYDGEITGSNSFRGKHNPTN